MWKTFDHCLWWFLSLLCHDLLQRHTKWDKTLCELFKKAVIFPPCNAISILLLHHFSAKDLMAITHFECFKIFPIIGLCWGAFPKQLNSCIEVLKLATSVNEDFSSSVVFLGMACNTGQCHLLKKCFLCSLFISSLSLAWHFHVTGWPLSMKLTRKSQDGMCWKLWRSSGTFTSTLPHGLRMWWMLHMLASFAWFALTHKICQVDLAQHIHELAKLGLMMKFDGCTVQAHQMWASWWAWQIATTWAGQLFRELWVSRLVHWRLKQTWKPSDSCDCVAVAHGSRALPLVQQIGVEPTWLFPWPLSPTFLQAP